MTTSTTPGPEFSPAGKPRVARTVCWAARLTSIPIFALLLISLVPALANYSVSARDDKIMAVGLCGVAAGFLAGWLWAGIGGLISLASVAAIVSQEDGGLSADPFSVAFGLQGILFLTSWVLNSSTPLKDGVPVSGLWFKRAAAGALVCAVVVGAATILRGPAPIPLTREQEAYQGVWESGTGFQMEITSDGRAKITQDKDAKVDPCNTPVKSGETAEFRVEFRDDRLELSRGAVGETKIYHIDRQPFPRAKRITMVLNGSDPYRRTNGMLLLKKQAAEVKADKRSGKARQS